MGQNFCRETHLGCIASLETSMDSATQKEGVTGSLEDRALTAFGLASERPSELRASDHMWLCYHLRACRQGCDHCERR